MMKEGIQGMIQGGRIMGLICLLFPLMGMQWIG
jgi:hypothetical protein